MKIALEYSAPVTVIVNTETEQVERVILRKNDVYCHDLSLTEQVEDIDYDDNESIQLAFDIAVDEDWPEWDEA